MTPATKDTLDSLPVDLDELERRRAAYLQEIVGDVAQGLKREGYVPDIVTSLRGWRLGPKASDDAHTRERHMLVGAALIENLASQLSSANARIKALEEGVKNATDALIEINPNNHDEDDVFNQNNSVIEAIGILQALSRTRGEER